MNMPGRRKWDAIASTLMTLREAPPARDRAAFWEDFSAHARLRTRGVPRAQWLPAIGVFRAAVVAACLLLAAGGVFQTIAIRRRPARVPVRSFDVRVPHRAVLILDDPGDRGTVLWVVGMRIDGEMES